LLLTKFHLYWKNCHFAGNSTKYKGIIPKRRHSGKCKTTNLANRCKRPNLGSNLGRSAEHPRPRPNHLPTSMRRCQSKPGLVCPRPPCCLLGPPRVGRCHYGRGWCGAGSRNIPPKLTIPPYIRGESSLTHTHTHTIWSSTPHSPLLSTL
jgi:hypothetical protein